MGTKSREVIWGDQIMGAEISAKSAREAATKAGREADRAEAHAWSLRMEGYGGPAQPSPTIGQCLNGGAGIRLQDLNVLPVSFELTFDNFHNVRRCQIIWRRGDFVGVQFQD